MDRETVSGPWRIYPRAARDTRAMCHYSPSIDPTGTRRTCRCREHGRDLQPLWLGKAPCTRSARMWGTCLIKRTNQGVYMMLGLPSVQEGSGTIVFKQHPCCSAGSCPCRCTSAPLRAEGPQGQGPHFALHHLLILLMLHY